MAAKFLDDIKKTLSYYDELDESPPRPRIALVPARFEERLRDEIMRRLVNFQGTSSLDKLNRKNREILVRIVRRSASQMSEFGYALGIFPYDTLADVTEPRRNSRKGPFI